MKPLKLFFTFITLIFIVGSVSAQKKKAKVSFEVAGVCGMCKKRIEKAAMDTNGVKYASWNVASHMLSLVINERKTSIDEIKENIATVGHSSEGFEAPQEAYDNLPACCKYNDPEVVKNHK